MIFANPNVSNAEFDDSNWASLWGFAHDGTAGIIPAHTLVVKNISAYDALLTPNTSHGYGLTLEPGDIVTMFVPAGDNMYAKASTGNTVHLQVIASVH